MSKAKVLYISQEIMPYNSESIISKTSRFLPEYIKENAEKDVRLFMPKFGSINERRYQLHEVIRLAGMNVVLEDMDYPLIIKVASVPEAKMQAYFMDNEELFARKAYFGDDTTPFFTDNHDRMIFFCQSVLMTIKKLGWVPDVIHCNGWMTSLIPYYIKQNFADEPVFKNAKIVFSAYNKLEGDLDAKLSKNAVWQNATDFSMIENPNWENLTKFASNYVDGMILHTDNNVMEDYLTKSDVAFVKSTEQEEEQYEALNNFYDQVLASEEVVA